MHVVVPNYRDLDGWDALLFLVGAVAAPVILAAMPFDPGPEALGVSIVVGGVIPFGVRRTFWPKTVKSDSRHTVLTLLLIAVGGFVTIIGLVLGALCAMLLHDTHGADAAPPAILVLPLAVLLIGGLLMFAGRRLARVKGRRAEG